MTRPGRSHAPDFRAEIDRRRLRFIHIVAGIVLTPTTASVALYVARGWWFPGVVRPARSSPASSCADARTASRGR